MVGYIDVGGGMRAVYGTGVLDRCLDENIDFSYYLGVSAGSANIVSFLGGHKERNLRFYRDYSYRKEYMSFDNYIKNKSFVNLDYIYSTLTNGDSEDPLDFAAALSKNCVFNIVATDAQKGETCYFDYSDMETDDYYAFKASCCIPIVCPAYEAEGKRFYDGGLSNPIPIQRALDDGCDKVVVTLTLPKEKHKIHKVPLWLYRILLKEYPASAKLMYTMIDKYNNDLEYIKRLEKEGKVLIIAPDDCCGVDTLKRTKKSLTKLYDKGYNDAEKIIDFLKD